jgi:uncharacterized protein (DUF3084 family)
MFRYQTILVLLLVLSVATCVIAYLSDKLGMKLGKKRISLLGLRPRQTATALSMGSSLLVMLFTMGLLLKVSPALRGALLHYDEARRENTRLGFLNEQLKTTSQQQQDAIQNQSQANQKLESSLRKRNFRLTELNNQVGEKQRLVNNAQGRLNVARQKLNSATQARDAAQQARDAAQQAQQQAKQGETQARGGEAQARAQFAQAQAAFVQAQQQEISARQGVVAARAQLSGARAQLSSARAELSGVRSTLFTTRTTLSSTRTQLSNARTNLADAEKKTEAAKFRTLQAQRRQLEVLRLSTQYEARLAVTQGKLKVAQQYLGQASGLLSGDIKVVVPVGQAFGATLIPAHSSKEQCLDALRALLSQSNRSVRQDGFQVLQLEAVQVQQGKQTRELSEDENLELYASFLAEQNAPISVRLVAARDYGENESEIVGRLRALAVRQVFAPGDVIAQTTISGEQSGAAGDALVFNRLMTLMDEGQKIAAERGISPLPTKDEPLLFASDTRLRIFEALRQIQQKGGDVPVRLVAATGLSTVQPVRVRIEVGAAETPSSTSSTPTQGT